MTINSNYSTSGWGSAILTSLTEVRDSLNRESLKLSSGRAANSYFELGEKVSPTLNLRRRLNSISANTDLISTANTQIGQVSQAITSFSKMVDNVTNGPLSLAGGNDLAARSSANFNLKAQFEALVSYLNNEDSSGYSFGGDVTNSRPVLHPTVLIDGSAGKAGLRQLFNERFAADSGSDGLGRLGISNVGSVVTLSETASIPFGLKLSTITSGLANATVSQASGTPPSESLTLTGQPNIGDQITFNFNLPDGGTSAITLKAATASGVGQFVIGSTPSDTAQNITSALTAAISNLVSTDLYSASAVYTAKNFFASTHDNPPERISGSPTSSATAIVAGTPSDTEIWYEGKTGSGDPRNDRILQIGDDISVNFGVRANEAGFQSVMAGVAAAYMVSSNFSGNTTVAASQMDSVRARTMQLTRDGQIGVQSIVTSIAVSQSATKMIDEQNKAIKSLLQARLSEFEDAKPEETAARISSLSTQLQASYQVAAKLLNLSLGSYL